MGLSFIEKQTDIRREVHEIYYGYSAYLERQFNNNCGIWGRKYTLYHQDKPIILMQEFFSPKLSISFKR